MAEQFQVLVGRPGASRRIALVGIPHDAASTLGRPGARYAPAEIRRALGWFLNRVRDGRVYDVEAGRIVAFTDLVVEDHGDVPVPAHDHLRVLETAREKLESLLADDVFVIATGGDHSVSLAGLRAFSARARGSLGIIQVDAHLDLVDENFRQGRYSGSSPMRRALELGPYRPQNLVQVGVRSFNYPDQFEFIQAQGIRQLPAAAIHAAGAREAGRQALTWARQGTGGVYLTIDVDALDPAFAPGTGADEPGGLTSAQLLELVRLLAPRVGVMDVVEVNPMADRGGVTSTLAAQAIFTAIVARAAEG